MSKAKEAQIVLPDPLSVVLVEGDREKAEKMLEDVSNLAIRYIRSAPTVAYHTDAKGRRVATVARGGIIGALVAFKLGENVVVGWSKRCCSQETLNSTKKRAVYVACLRAVAGDTVTIKTKNYGETRMGTVVPAIVVRELESFTHRATKYFGQKPSNVFYQDEVQGALAQGAAA